MITNGLLLCLTALVVHQAGAGDPPKAFDCLSQSKAGGRTNLVYGCRGNKSVVFSSEFPLVWRLSPDKKRIAISEGSGSAYNVNFVVAVDGNKVPIDDLLYAKLPGIHDYSHVYITPLRWVDSHTLEYQVSAHGPVKEALPAKRGMILKIDLGSRD